MNIKTAELIQSLETGKYYFLVSITGRNKTFYISHYQAIRLDQVYAIKIYRRKVCVFLFLKTCISEKLIFHITVMKRIRKSVPVT
jgi:hypothetical protein